LEVVSIINLIAKPKESDSPYLKDKMEMGAMGVESDVRKIRISRYPDLKPTRIFYSRD
jgi:hypothetical protein